MDTADTRARAPRAGAVSIGASPQAKRLEAFAPQTESARREIARRSVLLRARAQVKMLEIARSE
jgi:hypothetical protein